MAFEFIMDRFPNQIKSFKEQVESARTLTNATGTTIYKDVDEYWDIINMLFGHQTAIEGQSSSSGDINIIIQGHQTVIEGHQSTLEKIIEDIQKLGSQGGCQCDLSGILKDIDDLKNSVGNGTGNCNCNIGDVWDAIKGLQTDIQGLGNGNCNCNIGDVWDGIQGVQTELNKLKDKMDGIQGGDCGCDMSNITNEINILKQKIEGIQTTSISNITKNITNITENLWIPEITPTTEGYQTIFKKFDNSNK